MHHLYRHHEASVIVRVSFTWGFRCELLGAAGIQRGIVCFGLGVAECFAFICTAYN